MLIGLRCTLRCNFDCSYCFQRKQLEGGAGSVKMDMDLKLLDTIFTKLKYYLTHHASKKDRVVLEWTGGEPLLLGVDFFRKALEMEERIFRNVKQGVYNRIQTNGSLMSDKYIELIREYGIGLSTSNDVIGGARTINGKPVNELINRKMSFLREREIPFGCIVVVTKENSRGLLSIYRKMRKASQSFHFNYIKQISEYEKGIALSAKELVKSVVPVVKEYMLDRMDGKIDDSFHVKNLDEDIGMALGFDVGRMRYCNHIGCSMGFLSIEPDGSAYPCPSFTSDVSYLGNINKVSIRSLMEHPFRKNIQKRKRKLRKLCADCSLLERCYGGCMAEAFYGGDMFDISEFACEYRSRISEEIRAFVKKNWQ